MIKQSIGAGTLVAIILGLVFAAAPMTSHLAAQESTPQTAAGDNTVAAPADLGNAKPAMSFFDLLTRGGFLMWPLLAVSVLAVTLTIERAIALRREGIEDFTRKLAGLAENLLHEFRTNLAIAGQRGDLGQPRDLADGEKHVLQRGRVRRHALPSCAVTPPLPAAAGRGWE